MPQFLSRLTSSVRYFRGGFSGTTLMDDCRLDVSDPRGQMTPTDKGARKTGEYSNVFLEAGYSQTDIDEKLAQAYHDLFVGPDRIYFEVGDSMAYVSDLKNNDARTEGLSYGMMVAVQLDKKDVYDRLRSEEHTSELQ